MEIRANAGKRLLVPLAIVLCIAGSVAGAYGYHRVRLHREQQAWKADGIAASQAGDHVRAVALLTRYLRARADDVDALRSYAESRQTASPPDDAQAVADTILALKSLEQLTALRENEHRQLLELYAKSGDDDATTREADRLLAAHPNDAVALRVKTNALMRQRDWGSAVRVAHQWSQVAPDDLDAQSVELAAMQQSGAAPRDIVARAVALRRAHPGDARFELLESIALTLTDQKIAPAELAASGDSPDTRTAADWARLAGAHAPADLPYLHLLLDQLNRLALFDDSLYILRKSAASGDANSRRELARRLWESGQWEPLAQLLKDEPKGGSKADTELLCLYGAAVARLGRGSPDTAQIETDLSSRGNDPLAKAWLLLLKGFDGAVEEGPREQVEYLENALRRDLNNARLHYFHAEALERLGETDLAIQDLETATSLSATWAAPPARLVELLMERNRMDAALSAADTARIRAVRDGRIRDVPVAVILCRVWLAALTTGRSADASGLTQLIAAVQQASPGENETLSIRIALLVSAKDRVGASKMLADAIRTSKAPSESTLLSLAALSQGSGLGLEVECLDRCRKQYGNTPDLAYAQAIAQFAALAGGGAAKGLELFDAAHADRRDPADVRIELAWRAARARYLDAAGDPGAGAALIALADAHPEALGIQQMALSAPGALVDRDFTNRTIERVRKLTGDGGVQWRLARARWLLGAPSGSRKDVEAATRMLGAVVGACPQCADARLILASSLERLQQTDGALEQLQAAVALMPDSLDPAMRCAALLEDKGDFARAEQSLRRFTDGPLASPSALSATGGLEEREGNLDGAEKHYRYALSLRPDFGPAQRNLAMVLLRKGADGEVKEALTLAEQAAKAHPNAASIFDTLAAAQARNNDHENALVSIDRAIALEGSNRTFRVRQVELLLEAGRQEAARTALTRLESASMGASDEAAKDRDVATRVRKLHEMLIGPSTGQGPFP